VDDILQVLRDGPSAPARGTVTSKTPDNEELLGLDPAAYAYLGRASDQFGKNGFAVPISVPKGAVSPFDTGGLVKHIRPVCTWEDAERQAFLKDYSWTHSGLSNLLNQHPTGKGLADYLDGLPPIVPGPHQLWRGRVADIWAPGTNTWHAWTWEIRGPKLPAGREIVSWTCPPHIFEKIRQFADSVPDDAAWFEFLFGRYVPGGISQMFATQRNEQAKA
jgi:hypothetical protein